PVGSLRGCGRLQAQSRRGCSPRNLEMRMNRFTPLVDFTSAYTSIGALLDAAVDNGPHRAGWDGYDAHSETLRRCAPAVAVLLVRQGGETPEQARSIVEAVQDTCDRAKALVERLPYSHQQAERAFIRGRVSDPRLLLPLQQLLTVIEQDLEE